ncbi:major facilitator superfamily domain-containing protein [Halenospora varia]|nr:major facilitator superfamily domain-containing protein [Halenospora varia]
MPETPLRPQGSHYSSIQPSDSNSDSEESSLTLNGNGNKQKQQRKPLRKSREPGLYDPARRGSFDEEDGDPLSLQVPPRTEEKPVTWTSLPHKGQLLVLCLARLSEPLVQSSLRSYVFYQLKSFDKSLPDATIAYQAGIIQGAFAAAQLCTAMLWGRMSDDRGRKSVILFGLSGAMMSCIGFGFSSTFTQALVFRSLGGALNGNVGVMRTMISEIIREKKFQSRAFLLLPMVANVGVIIGPMLGGLTSDPVAAYPGLFGGIKWLETFPYSPPNILSAIFLAFASLAVWLGLEETHDAFIHRKDFGVTLSRKVAAAFRKIRGARQNDQNNGYLAVDDQDPNTPVVELSATAAKSSKRVGIQYPNKLPFRRIFTYNVVTTLISHALLALSMGTFQSIFYTFLSTPVYDPADFPADYHPHPPLTFTGGVGLPPRSIGFAMAILGTIGIIMQLFLYPIINNRFGTVLSWRMFLYCFPVVYTLVPFLAIIPSTTPAPSPKTGVSFWAALTALIFIFVIGRTFAAPAAQILVNNCCPHPTVLGTVHGMGQSASAAARTVGPALGGWVYGVGLEKGVVGATFWALAGVAGLSCFASNFVKDGDGHEIRLEGDDEAEAEAEVANRGFR